MKKVLTKEDLAVIHDKANDEEIGRLDEVMAEVYKNLGYAEPNWTAMYLYTGGKIYNEPGFDKLFERVIKAAAESFDYNDVVLTCEKVNEKLNLAHCTVRNSANLNEIYSVLPLPADKAEDIIKSVAIGYYRFVSYVDRVEINL